MKKTKYLLLLLLLLLAVPALPQKKAKFHIVSFGENPHDMSPKNHEKLDPDGHPYAIIKVTSNNPDDNLGAYSFDFEHIPHIVEVKDGELWVYVGRNAMFVNISREGYHSIKRYDLGLTIRPGRAYEMQLSAETPEIKKQIVRFNITPVEAKAVVMYKSENEESEESVFGYTDENGSVAKLMPLGMYVYKVKSEYWHTNEGRFVLDGSKKVHEENVTLRPNSANVELKTAYGTDIYLDGELLGKGKWRGILKKGSYNVECRRDAHRNSLETIVIEDGKDMVVELKAPTPITGSISVNSTPLDAQIIIDGKEYGKTPNIIDSLIIGPHEVVVSKSGYKDKNQTVEIREGELFELDVLLEVKPREGAVYIQSDPVATIELDGKVYGSAPATLNNLPEGKHRIKLSKNGYNSFISEIDVKGGSTENVFVALMPLKGTLNVTSYPSDAEIQLNGESYGYTPRNIVNLPFGKYKVKVSKKNYKSQSCKIYIKDESVVRQHFLLACRENMFKKVRGWKLWNWLNLGLNASTEYGFVAVEDCRASIWGAGVGVLLRIGNTNSIFNIIGGAKYCYSRYAGYEIQQKVYPIILNWNFIRNDDTAIYMGIGYEHGSTINNDESVHNYECDCGEYHDITSMMSASNVFFQVGAGGRHFDSNLYLKTSMRYDYTTFGIAFTFFL